MKMIVICGLTLHLLQTRMETLSLEPQPTWTANPFNLELEPKGYLVGLHVWSGSPNWGKELELTSITEASYVYTATPIPKPLCRWQSRLV
jgi:hypothetical protein